MLADDDRSGALAELPTRMCGSDQEDLSWRFWHVREFNEASVRDLACGNSDALACGFAPATAKVPSDFTAIVRQNCRPWLPSRPGRSFKTRRR